MFHLERAGVNVLQTSIVLIWCGTVRFTRVCFVIYVFRQGENRIYLFLHNNLIYHVGLFVVAFSAEITEKGIIPLMQSEYIILVLHSAKDKRKRQVQHKLRVHEFA